MQDFTQNKLAYGLKIEEQALVWLKSVSPTWELLASNYRWKGGELDLVGLEGPNLDELVFIEIRARAMSSWVSALESVNFPKQKRLARTIRHFLCTTLVPQAKSLRFDVITWEGGEFKRFKNLLLPEL